MLLSFLSQRDDFRDSEKNTETLDFNPAAQVLVLSLHRTDSVHGTRASMLSRVQMWHIFARPLWHCVNCEFRGISYENDLKGCQEAPILSSRTWKETHSETCRSTIADSTDRARMSDQKWPATHFLASAPKRLPVMQQRVSMTFLALRMTLPSKNVKPTSGAN